MTIHRLESCVQSVNRYNTPRWSIYLDCLYISFRYKKPWELVNECNALGWIFFSVEQSSGWMIGTQVVLCLWKCEAVCTYPRKGGTYISGQRYRSQSEWYKYRNSQTLCSQSTIPNKLRTGKKINIKYIGTNLYICWPRANLKSSLTWNMWRKTTMSKHRTIFQDILPGIIIKESNLLQQLLIL